MEILQQTAAVLFVLALLAAALWWLRRSGMARLPLTRGNSSGRRLESIERLPLGAQHSLHLIRVDGQTILVALSPGGCSVLHTSSFSARTEVIR